MQQLNDYRVPTHFASVHIDQILAIEFSNLSRSQWQHEISAGIFNKNPLLVMLQNQLQTRLFPINRLDRDDKASFIDRESPWHG